MRIRYIYLSKGGFALFLSSSFRPKAALYVLADAIIE